MSGPARTFAEDDLLPLSALQHLVFCERQCALIHVEQLWKDNPLTLEGAARHHRVHEGAPRREVRGDLVVARGVAVRSLLLGVSGIVDVIEFHRGAASTSAVGATLAAAVPLPGLGGLWTPFPVEYKKGKPKLDHCDEVQVCAQALCLEEMLGVAVPEGALFYGATQHRDPVEFSEGLRSETRRAAVKLHKLCSTGRTPRAQREPKCQGCSLVEVCRPDAMAPRRSARRYLADALDPATREEVGSA